MHSVIELLPHVERILVEECGAIPDHFESYGFRAHVAEHFNSHVNSPLEWRFQGGLGFGGKVWLHQGVGPSGATRARDFYVSCYSEDETPERKASIEKANVRLAQLTQATEAHD